MTHFALKCHALRINYNIGKKYLYKSGDKTRMCQFIEDAFKTEKNNKIKKPLKKNLLE